MCLAIPAKIVDVVPGDDQASALVDVVGVRRRVNTGLLLDDPPKPGDWVLVHVGFAMSKISEEQALDQIQTLNMMGEQQAALEEVSGYGVDEGET